MKDLVNWMISVDWAKNKSRWPAEVSGMCTISQVFHKWLVIWRALFLGTSSVLKEPIFWESAATRSFKTRLKAFETCQSKRCLPFWPNFLIQFYHSPSLSMLLNHGHSPGHLKTLKDRSQNASSHFLCPDWFGALQWAEFGAVSRAVSYGDDLSSGAC